MVGYWLSCLEGPFSLGRQIHNLGSTPYGRHPRILQVVKQAFIGTSFLLNFQHFIIIWPKPMICITFGADHVSFFLHHYLLWCMIHWELQLLPKWYGVFLIRPAVEIVGLISIFRFHVITGSRQDEIFLKIKMMPNVRD